MRIWYVEKGGTSASRIAKYDPSAADDTRQFNTLAHDAHARSRPRRVRSVAAD